MEQWPQHVLITGGTGYIGSRLVALARARGWLVTLLTRSTSGRNDDPGVRLFDWTLEADPPDAAFRTDNGFPPIDAVIHLAHQWHSGAPDEPDLTSTSRARSAFWRRHGSMGSTGSYSPPPRRRDATPQIGTAARSGRSSSSCKLPAMWRRGSVWCTAARPTPCGVSYAALCKLARCCRCLGSSGRSSLCIATRFAEACSPWPNGKRSVAGSTAWQARPRSRSGYSLRFLPGKSSVVAILVAAGDGEQARPDHVGVGVDRAR